ncbi:MAG TPA: hypothetical protein VGI66_09965 [Streptosporangiaceae bacterium]
MGNEGALAGAGVDKAASYQPFDGIADGVARRPVLSLEIELGGERLTVAADLCGFDLLAQILGTIAQLARIVLGRYVRKEKDAAIERVRPDDPTGAPEPTTSSRN